MKVKSEVVQSCLTLSDPMDCSLPGSSVHGIFQARVLEWDAIAFSDTLTYFSIIYKTLPVWLSCYRICLQCGRPGFDPWVGKIPWRRERLPTPVFWPGEFLDSILKSRDITLPTKVHLVKAMVFPVVMYGCESWTVKAERRRTDAFELWCWRRLLRVPWTARRSNESILKELSPGCSLEGMMLS